MKVMDIAQKKRLAVYITTMLALGLAGLSFGPIGGVVGLGGGYFVAHRIINNKTFAAGVAKRKGITDSIWAYLTLAATGFIFFNLIGLFAGPALLFVYNTWVKKK
jgi:hypothetical protein